MSIEKLLYSPPVVFVLITALIALFAFVVSKLSTKGNVSSRGLESYACGQRGFKEYVNPDYTQFFTYAFIFTVMHVLTMVAAMAPKEKSAMPVIYLLAGIYIIRLILKR